MIMISSMTNFGLLNVEMADPQVSMAPLLPGLNFIELKLTGQLKKELVRSLKISVSMMCLSR